MFPDTKPIDFLKEACCPPQDADVILAVKRAYFIRRTVNARLLLL